MELNRKEYPDTGLFEKRYVEEYCNLNIYPRVNEIETEAGLLSDFAEAFALQNNPATYHIYADASLESTMFFKDCLLNFVTSSQNVIGYIDYPIKHFENFDYIHVLLGPEHSNFDSMFYKKVIVHGLSKVLYLSRVGEEIFNKYFWYYLDTGVFKYSITSFENFLSMTVETNDCLAAYFKDVSADDKCFNRVGILFS
jgi:hypothetical protein